MTTPVIQFKRGAFVNLPGLRGGEPGFTTDKYDFYIGLTSETSTNQFFGSGRYWGRENGTTSLRFKLVDKDGTNHITLKTPNTLTGVGTYTLPDPSTIVSGYFLKVASDGTLSWAADGTSTGSLSNIVLAGISTVSGIYFDVNTDADFSGITTFSNTTDNTLGDPNTGAVQIDGGLGVNKNVTIGAGLSVAGNSHFIGTATFYGGTINLGNEDTDDIVVAGEFKSNLIPSNDATYSLGTGTKRWNNASFAGIGSFDSGVDANNITIGIGGANTITTSSGKLTLNSATNTVEIAQHLDIIGDLDVTGNVYIGGTTVTLRGTDVFIENKDIVLGYTTTTTPNDTTANHAGVAIASTEGTPLVSFTASGINTLPDTYKQMMWFKSGTLGFATDAFAFNYGVAIGTTTMADGVRLAVGSGITISDNSISATSANFTNLTASNITGTMTGTISTATRATTVDTTSTSTNTNYHLVFTDNASSTDGATMRVDAGIYYNPSSNNLFASQFIGNIVAGTIKAADTTTSMTLANSTGNVTFNGDIQIGGNDIKASDGTTALTLSITSGNVKTGGDLIAGSGYLDSADGTRAMYMYDTSGDVSFQGKVIANNYRSSSNSSNTLTFNDLDATFARNLTVTGIATVGTALSTPTVRTNLIKSSDTNATAITIVDNDVTVADNLTVGGNLYVNGSTTQVNTSSLTVEDRTIQLGVVDGAAPSTATTWDLGVLFNYYTDSAKQSAVVWEHSDARFKFGSIVTDGGGTDSNSPQITVGTYAPIEIGALWVNDCAGQSQVITCSGSERLLQNITIDGGAF
jgi:hypothetical protein